jgi:ABC-type nickel/cobalt efflux system permease component RcnA
MEDLALPMAFALGFLSGFKHAFEPDHVIAVSTLLHRDPKLSRALRTGLAWGAGHTTTLVVAVLAVGLLRVQISEAMLAYFELPVAFMLLGLGVWASWHAATRMMKLRRHTHEDDAGENVEHYHVGAHDHPHGFSLKRTGWQGYAVGMVHGLAGSGALLLLVAATLPSLVASVGYALVFGVGSVLGMGAVTAMLALPFLASRRRPAFFHALTGLSGVFSIVLGASILYALWR